MQLSDLPNVKVYLVGGAVRDRLLGLPVKDRDWVVTGATVGQMLDCGFEKVGAAFPVFIHPETREEYALARRERKTGEGHKGFTFEFGTDVTLEEDLYRRDFTINAMAMDTDGNVIDPYGGQKDLSERRITAVNPQAFMDDPLRILRGIRFAARYAFKGFAIKAQTYDMMWTAIKRDQLDTLSDERIWGEIRKVYADAVEQKSEMVIMEFWHLIYKLRIPRNCKFLHAIDVPSIDNTVDHAAPACAFATGRALHMDYPTADFVLQVSFLNFMKRHPSVAKHMLQTTLRLMSAFKELYRIDSAQGDEALFHEIYKFRYYQADAQPRIELMQDILNSRHYGPMQTFLTYVGKQMSYVMAADFPGLEGAELGFHQKAKRREIFYNAIRLQQNQGR